MGFEDLGEDLSEEQKARLRECKTKEEFVSILEKGGCELTLDMLEEVAGGQDYGSDQSPCPQDESFESLFCGFYFKSRPCGENT